MTSPKPKLTELLDWIDSHLVYCFSLIRNKYFHTVLSASPSWVFILWWSSAYVGDLADWVFTGIIDHSFVLSINKIWRTIRAFLTFNVAKLVQGKQTRKVLVCGDQS